MFSRVSWNCASKPIAFKLSDEFSDSRCKLGGTNGSPGRRSIFAGFRSSTTSYPLGTKTRSRVTFASTINVPFL